MDPLLNPVYPKPQCVRRLSRKSGKASSETPKGQTSLGEQPSTTGSLPNSLRTEPTRLLNI